MYRALYRKWRPATFEDVVGQTGITTALKNQILHDKVGHAYIFTGTRGTGKTTCAKIFAKAVNCQNRNQADPCGKCTVCTGIDDGGVMDVVEIDAASNNGVDNIRDLRDETAYTPSVCAYKVYIIDEVHMLSTAAFNALLKIMEEPPSHIIFILATTEIHKVPATILSRCQRYDFTRITPLDIEGRLRYVAAQENINLDQPAAALISRLADGALRDALSILDTCAGVTNDVSEDVVRSMAGVTDKSYLFAMSDAVCAKDAVKALALAAQLREKSIDLKRLCEELIFHYRNLLLAGFSGAKELLTGVSMQEEERYIENAKALPQNEAVRAIKVLGAALDKMGKGTDARIELELALFTLCETTAQAAPALSVAAPVQNAQVFVSAPSAAPVVNYAAAMPAVPATVPQPAAGTPLPPVAEGKVEEPFSAWDKVIQESESKDKRLFVNMKNSKAYYDGKRVLIDGSELFLEYMRQNKYSSALIKETIAAVTGVKYAIGPYDRGQKVDEKQQSAVQTLDLLAQQGVEVVYNN